MRFLMTGLGGYAKVLTDLFDRLKRSTLKVPAELIAICEPRLEEFPLRVAELRARGLRLYSCFEDMLSSEEADAIWLPLPIHLHRSYTERALQRGLHVVTEKPAAGAVQDVDAMIAAMHRSTRKVLVAFQDIYASHTLATKKLLIEGAIGRPEQVVVYASWPRGRNYYERNDWAGALEVDGLWVLDSPLQNALSHYLQLAMFLVGDTLRAVSSPTAVTAELYRANAIENFDTCAVRVELDGGPTMLVFFTHASIRTQNPVIEITGSEGMVRIDGDGVRFSGKTAITVPLDKDRMVSMVRGITSHLGEVHESDELLVVDLPLARPHVVVVNGVSEASLVHAIGPEHLSEFELAPTDVGVAIDGIEGVMSRCVEHRLLPSELGDVPWSRFAGRCSLRNYSVFFGPKIPANLSIR